jgi:hypothetical protein
MASRKEKKNLLQILSMFGPDPAPSVRATLRRQRQLGRALRRLYRPIANEPVPEDMLEKLKQIDQISQD